MLSIRFVRIGKKKHPLYRLVIMQRGKNPHSAYMENLGTYNPHTKEKNIKTDRVEHWLKQGAQPTATVHNLLVDHKLIKEEKVRASKSQPGKKKQAALAIKKAEEVAAQKAQAAEKAAAEAAAKEAQEKAAEVVPEEKPVEEIKPE